MKKIIAIIPLLLVLSWCFMDKEYKYLSFEESEIKLSENITSFVDNIDKILNIDNTNTISKINLSADDDNLQMKANFSNTWFYYDNENRSNNSDISIYFFDKKENNQIDLSWNIDSSHVDDKYFIKFSNMDINMWKWNYEWDLVNLIANNLDNKRINYDNEYLEDTKDLLESIVLFLNTISSTQAFYMEEQVVYEWNLAYKISIKPELLDYFNSKSLYVIDKFDWLLIIKSDSEINLRIVDMEIWWKYSLKISWDFWKKEWYIDIDYLENKYQISYNISKKYISIDTVKSVKLTQIWKNISKISKYNKDGDILYRYEWNLNISPLFIYWTNLEKETKINIRWSYEKISWKFEKNKIPDSFLLLNQILWDNYSLASLIWK